MTADSANGLIGQQLGGFQIQGLLGSGGMAEVYRGVDLALGREVAVKVLPASLATDPGFVERLRNEARLVAALNQPNIVPVYTFDQERGLFFLVMPVLRESLRDRLDREGRLPPSDAARLVVQVASALDAAHAIGLVHRDVKPENILLNAEGKALLTDFGIAREMSFLRESGTARTLASTGLPVGTPEYMAPEQLRGGAADQRADIYALGTVLYEVLTGVVPFDAETPYEVAALVLTEPLIPPSVRNPEVWPELDDVVLTTMAKDREDRYPDARSFAIALRRAVVERGSSNRADVPRVAPRTRRLSQGLEDSVPRSALAVLDADSAQYDVVDGHATGGTGRQSRGRRWMLLAALVVVLLAGIGGIGTLTVLSSFGIAPGLTSSFLPGIDPGEATATANATSTSGAATRTAGPNSVPVSTARPGQSPNPGQTPLPGQTPSPGSTTAPTATSTTLPAPLTLSANTSTSPLTLTHPRRTNYCYTASQPLTITNTAQQTVGWKWVSNTAAQQAGFTFYLTYNNGSTTQKSWPSDTSPGIPPGGSDSVTVGASYPYNYANGSSFDITVQDTLGNSYPLTLVVSC